MNENFSPGLHGSGELEIVSITLHWLINPFSLGLLESDREIRKNSNSLNTAVQTNFCPFCTVLQSPYWALHLKKTIIFDTEMLTAR